jgi:Lrp/AsnC family leucine-responsive transcriptional regulator
MKNTKMDKNDIKLLRSLRESGRQSWLELSEKVSLSASACQRRVQTLLDKGIIKRFSVVVDEQAMGYSIKAFVNVKVQRQDTKSANDFKNRIKDQNEVQACHMLSGDIDFLLEVVATDLSAFTRFMEEKILSSSAVKDATSSIVLKVIKTHKNALPS